jgi:hypothetical protein
MTKSMYWGVMRGNVYAHVTLIQTAIHYQYFMRFFHHHMTVFLWGFVLSQHIAPPPFIAFFYMVIVPNISNPHKEYGAV